MEEEKRFKMAIIAGAAQAFRHKEQNPKATEQDVMQHVTDKVDEILHEIDEEI